jgi:hypothetical protein
MPKKRKRHASGGNHDFFGMGYVPDPVFGPSIPGELLARRRADSKLAAAFRKLSKKRRPAKKTGKRKAKRRAGKKRASPAQLRARKAFAARARARAKSGMAGRMRAGTRYNPKTASKAQKALYARALRVAKAAPKKKTGRKPSKKRGTQRSVTAAQVIAMAKKGALQKWLCQGRKRTGCGSSGRVVSGKGRFVRLR